MIAGIYLAAGNSRRMGRQKQLLTLGSSYLGSWGLKALIDSSIDIVIVIVKPQDDLEWIALALKESNKLRIVRCLDAVEGQGASIKCGIRVTQMIQAEASIISLADMPFVSKAHINSLLTIYSRNEYDYVASKSERTFSPPVIFSKKLFQELLTLKGDEGAKSILRKKQWKGTYISTHPYHSLDIDTVDDYKNAKNILIKKIGRELFDL